MHGFGVVPAAWAATYGSTTWRSKSSLKLNTRWSMSSCWATRRASSTSATLQQPVSLSPPHSRIVTPTTSWPSRAQQRGGDRRVDAAAHRDEHLHRASPRRPGRASRSRPTAATTASSGGVDVGRGRRAPEREPQRTRRPTRARRPSPPARATAPSPRWRTPTPPTRHTPASSSRYSSASLSMPSNMHVRRPGDLGAPAAPSPGRRRRAPTTASTSRSRSAATARSRPAARRRWPRGPRPWRRCRRRCACRCAARAPARRR